MVEATKPETDSGSTVHWIRPEFDDAITAARALLATDAREAP